MSPLGLILIAIGIVLEALHSSTPFDTAWLGGALILLGAVEVGFELVRSHLK